LEGTAVVVILLPRAARRGDLGGVDDARAKDAPTASEEGNLAELSLLLLKLFIAAMPVNRILPVD